MSLSFIYYNDFGGIPIAVVNNLDKKTKKQKTLYMYTTQVPDGQMEVSLEGDEEFEKTIDDSQEREVIYVSGMSGAGKSWFCREYIKQYKKKFPKRSVYVFSALDKCDTLDKLKYLKRIKIKNQEFINRSIDIEDLRESLCLFDDCDTITDRQVRNKVFQIQDNINQTGRHCKVTCLVTSHNATSGNLTRVTLNEATTIVLYPKCSGNKTLYYLSDQYLGLDKEETKDLKKIQGRFVAIVRKHPRCIFSLKKCKMLNDN